MSTVTSTILERHGVRDLSPGAFALVSCDLVMLNEVSGAFALRAFDEMGADQVFDRDRVALVCDHFVPAKDADSAELVSGLRRFAERQRIEQYWEVGRTLHAGIEHTLLPEVGLVAPGDLIIGGDSHTCTYGAFGAVGLGMGSTDIAATLALGEIWIRVPEVIDVEFTGAPGPFTSGKDLILALLARTGTAGANYQALEFRGAAVTALNLDERMALCNMSVEAGAKTGLVAADERTRSWLDGRLTRPYPELHSDDSWHARLRIDVQGLKPMVAQPPSPAAAVAVDSVDGPVKVDQVYVGNCANGTITDLRQLASMLAGRTVAAGTRLIVVPATQAIYGQALREGILETVLAAGGMVSPPTCGACFGGHMGILAAGETAVATTNRNFRGRMGHPDSRVYLANAYVAGAAAVSGELLDPGAVAPGP